MIKLNCSKIAKFVFILLITPLFVVAYFSSQKAQAQMPSTINFQGKIVRNDSGYEGMNVTTGSPACVQAGADTCDFQVKYYSASSGGTLFLTETFADKEIGQYGGVFELSLGSGSITAGSHSTLDEVIQKENTIFIEVGFSPAGNSTFTETFTRMYLQANAFAIRSKYSEMARGAFKFENAANSSGYSGSDGMVYYDTTTGGLKLYSAGVWLDISTGTASSLWGTDDISSYSHSPSQFLETSGIATLSNFGLDTTLNRAWIHGASSRTGFSVYSNYGGATDWPLVTFKADASNFGNSILQLIQDGTGSILEGYKGSNKVFDVDNRGDMHLSSDGILYFEPFAGLPSSGNLFPGSGEGCLYSTGGNIYWDSGCDASAPTMLNAASSSLWTDAGSFTYLTSTSDNLVLGGNSVATATFFFDMTGASGRYFRVDNYNNTETLFTIDSSGNVGIGTATPGAKLDIGGSSANISNAIGDITIIPAQNLIISQGNVGIGNSSPTSLLSVGSTSQFQVDSNGDLVKIKNLTYSWPTAHTTSGLLSNNGTGTLTWNTAADLGLSSGTGVAGQITFWNGTSTIAGDNNLWWDNVNKRLGIGTTTPQATIDIAGASSEIANTSGSIIIAPAENLIVSQGKFAVGTFGAGNLAPASKFHMRWANSGAGGGMDVGGQLMTDAAVFENSGNVHLQLMGGASSEKSISFATPTNAAHGAIKYNYTGSPGGVANGFGFWTNGNTFRMALDSSGNLGIGISAPSFKLDVDGSSMRLGSTTTGNVSFYVGANTTHRYLQFMNEGAASGIKVGGLLVSDTYSFGNPGRNDLIVKGNVGIGTASPTGKMQVVGGTGLCVELDDSSCNTGITSLGAGDIVSNYYDTAGGHRAMMWDVSGASLYLQRVTGDVSAVNIFGRKARLAAESYSTIASGDDLLLIRAYAYAGSTPGWTESSRIHLDTEGTIGNSIAPGLMRFYTANSAGALTQRMTINSNGIVNIASPGSGTYTLGLGRLSGTPTIKSTESWLIMDSNGSPAALNYFHNANVSLAFGGGNVIIGNTANNTYKVEIVGGLRASGSINTTEANGFRIISGNYGTFWRSDGSSAYFLITASGDQYGSWNTLRPLTYSLTSGYVTLANGHGDISERFTLKGSAVRGMILSISKEGNVVEKSLEESTPVGIVSTAPAVLMGFGGQFEVGHNAKEIYSNEIVPVALTGTVPTIITTENGHVSSGDSISISSIPGVGAKSIKAEATVGLALESSNSWNVTACPTVPSVESIVWPADDDGQNRAKPCYRLPNGEYIGKILVVVDTSWQDSSRSVITNINTPGWYRVAELRNKDDLGKLKINNKSIGSSQNLSLNISSVNNADIINVLSNFSVGGYEIEKVRINNINGIKYLEIYFEETNDNILEIKIENSKDTSWIVKGIIPVQGVFANLQEYQLNGVLLGVSDSFAVTRDGLSTSGTLLTSGMFSDIGNSSNRWNDIYTKGTIRLGSGNSEGGIRYNVEKKRLEFSNDGINWVEMGDLTSNVVISPEYSGAILYADGSDNHGRMTSDAINTGGVFKNYYEWKSDRETLQDYDILVRITLPNDFVSWKEDAISLDFMTENSASIANNKVEMALMGDSGIDSEIKNGISKMPGAWERISIKAVDITQCKKAGDSCTLRLSMYSKENYYVRVGDISLNYNRGL